MLENSFIFNKYGNEILDIALEKNNSVVLEKIFDSCLHYFKKDMESNISLLQVIVSHLPKLGKNQYKLISKFFIQTSIVPFPSHSLIEVSDVFYKGNFNEIFTFKKKSFSDYYASVKASLS